MKASRTQLKLQRCWKNLLVFYSVNHVQLSRKIMEVKVSFALKSNSSSQIIKTLARWDVLFFFVMISPWLGFFWFQKIFRKQYFIYLPNAPDMRFLHRLRKAQQTSSLWPSVLSSRPLRPALSCSARRYLTSPRMSCISLDQLNHGLHNPRACSRLALH